MRRMRPWSSCIQSEPNPKSSWIGIPPTGSRATTSMRARIELIDVVRAQICHPDAAERGGEADRVRLDQLRHLPGAEIDAGDDIAAAAAGRPDSALVGGEDRARLVVELDEGHCVGRGIDSSQHPSLCHICPDRSACHDHPHVQSAAGSGRDPPGSSSRPGSSRGRCGRRWARRRSRPRRRPVSRRSRAVACRHVWSRSPCRSARSIRETVSRIRVGQPDRAIADGDLSARLDLDPLDDRVCLWDRCAAAWTCAHSGSRPRLRRSRALRFPAECRSRRRSSPHAGACRASEFACRPFDTVAARAGAPDGRRADPRERARGEAARPDRRSGRREREPRRRLGGLARSESGRRPSSLTARRSG